MAIEIKIGASFNDADIKRAQRELNNLAKVTSRASMTMAQRLAQTGQQFQQLGRNMTMQVTAPLVAAGAVAVKFASDLQESQSKVNVVFGQSAQQVSEFGESAAESLGMSQAAALEASGTYGNLFRAMGMTEQQSAGMSTSLVQLAADLGSFNNVPVDQVFDALRSGLSGETEPLKRFGVNINAARIQTEALSLGLAEQGQELSSAAKAQAIYSIIMKDTTLAQGDFARTADGAANSMKTARAQLEDAAAEIGTALLPMVSKAAEMIGKFAGFIANLPGPMKTAIVTIGGLAAAFGPVIWATGGVLRGVSAIMEINWRAGFGRAIEAAKGMSSAIQGGMAQALAAIRSMSTGAVLAMGAFGLAVAAAGVALMHFVNRQAEQARAQFKSLNASTETLAKSMELLAETGQVVGPMEDLTVALRHLESETDGNVNQIARLASGLAELTPIGDTVKNWFTEVDDNASAAQETFGRFDDRLASLSTSSMPEAIKQFEAMQQAAAAEGYELTIEMFPQLASAIETAAGAANMSTDDFMNLAGAGTDIKTEFEQATEALQDWEDEVRSQFDPLFAYGDSLDTLAEAQRRQEEAAWNALGAVSEHGSGSTKAQSAIRDYKASIRDTTSATFDTAFQLERLKEGLRTGGVDFITAAQHLDGLVASGLMTEEQARLTKDEWARLADQVNITPSYKQIMIDSNASTVLDHVRNLKAILADSTTTTWGKVRAFVEYGQNANQADGGPVMAGRAGWVGERGPELFIPNVDGTIVPHYQSRRIMDELDRGSAQTQGESGATYNITINGLVGRDKRDVLDFLARELPKQAALTGRAFG